MSLVSIFAGTVNSYAPPAPASVSAAIVVQSGADGTTARITYTAPSYNSSLVPTISSFTAYAVEDPSKTATVSTSASGTIDVTGLTLGTLYTFKVYATNSFGKGPDSAATNAVRATTVSQSNYTTAGTYTFTVPAGVYSISILLIGGGGAGGDTYGSGGGGGALTYLNDYAVTPGQTFEVRAGAGGNTTNGLDGQSSYFGNTTLLFAGGGQVGQSGLSGGYINSSGGGGGAAGYAGDGGQGGSSNNDGSNPGYLQAWFGQGGVGGGTLPGFVTFSGGRGGQGYNVTQCSFSAATLGGGGGAGAGGSGGYQNSAGGGGVGIFGQSSVDSLGSTTTAGPSRTRGQGPSYVSNGGSGGVSSTSTNSGSVLYGGGARGALGRPFGSRGAVRIVYPGDRRQFPSTNVGNF